MCSLYIPQLLSQKMKKRKRDDAIVDIQLSESLSSQLEPLLSSINELQRHYWALELEKSLMTPQAQKKSRISQTLVSLLKKVEDLNIDGSCTEVSVFW